jgi:hypothetical protein
MVFASGAGLVAFGVPQARARRSGRPYAETRIGGFPRVRCLDPDAPAGIASE